MFYTMLQIYVPNVSSALDVCCIQVFHVACVSYSRGMFRESLGHAPDTVGKGTTSRGSVGGARAALGVLRTGRARPHLVPGSRSARRERRGSGEGVPSMGHDVSNKGGVRVQGGIDGPFNNPTIERPGASNSLR
jgi:hypothetical protein